MNLGIRTKLALVSVGLVAISVVSGDLFLTRTLARSVIDRIRDDLLIRVELLSLQVSQTHRPLDDIAGWDSLADSLGQTAHARVTIIRRDGKVIGDSEVETPDLARVENHAGRPEVIEAYQHGHGTSSRWSATIHERMMYVAEPFGPPAAPIGVVRMAMPLTEVSTAVRHVRVIILVATALALAVAIFMSTLAASWVAQSVRRFTSVAQRMAGGDLTAKTEVNGRDEIAELARALNQLGASLSATLDRLRSERDLQERILFNMREGVVLVDANGRIALVNPAALEMLLPGNGRRLRASFGRAPGGDGLGSLASASVLEVIRSADLHALFESARATGESRIAEIEVFPAVVAGAASGGASGGGRPLRLLCHVTPVAGEVAGTLGVLMDVTDIRRLETVRKDFVANVSHELRTPLAAIASSAETLRHGAGNDPVASDAFIDIIERNAARMKALVEDLLDLSRIEAGELQFRMEPIDVGALVEHVAATFRRKAEERRILLLTEMAPSVPCVEADRRAFEQILINLVDNAVKYSQEGGTITVGAAVESGGVRIAIRDTGPGIEPRHLPRIFERFYRVDSGRSRDLGGTGLGLAIVKHLTEAMGGTVGVDSAIGHGSTFSVLLPRA